MNITVVTPEKAILDTTAEFVVLPMFDGERGIGAGHAAFVGQLGPGEFRYTSGGKVTKFYIDGGFAQVRTNKITVLTAKAIPATDLTPAKAEDARLAAEKLPATNPVEQVTREKAIARATAMSRIAAKQG
ncbi:MAG: ATP synthase F1 subunit epsilon [Fimbriiglobus sp.]